MQGGLRRERREIRGYQGVVENMLRTGARLAWRAGDGGRIRCCSAGIAALRLCKMLKLLLDFMDVYSLARMLPGIRVSADMRMGERRHALQECECQNEENTVKAPHFMCKVLSVAVQTGRGAVRFIFRVDSAVNRGFPEDI